MTQAASDQEPPALPEIRLELISEAPRADAPGFLWIVRRTYRAHYPDGGVSAPFTYDAVSRRALDAVVLVAYARRAGEVAVLLRSAVRPPLVLRDGTPSPCPRDEVGTGLWELPAGLIEPDERGTAGARLAASRELGEETGLVVAPDAWSELGRSTLPSPGVIAERHLFFAAEVDPDSAAEPSLDGSALEQQGQLVWVSLERALDWCRAGALADAKTELGLRRLAERELAP